MTKNPPMRRKDDSEGFNFGSGLLPKSANITDALGNFARVVVPVVFVLNAHRALKTDLLKVGKHRLDI